MLFFLLFLLFPFISSLDYKDHWAFHHERVSSNAIIYIHEIDGKWDFNLMIQSQRQYNKYETFTCKNNLPTMSYVSTSKINSTGFPQAFPIMSGGGVYYFSIFNCNRSFIINSISFSFLNSWGRLPFSKYPCIYITAVESAFYLVLFVLFIINVCNHMNLLTRLHVLIGTTIGISFLSCILSASLLISTNRKDSDFVSIKQNAIYISSSVFLCFRNFCLLMLTLFLSSGLSIVYEKLEICTVFWIVFVSGLLGILGFLFDSDALSSWPSIFRPVAFMLFIMVFVLEILYLIRLSAAALATLNAHMEMIDSAGIDSNTTPTYRKRQLLSKLRIYSIVLQGFFFVSLLLYQSGAFLYFISYLIISFANALLLSFICWKCRLRKNMAASYYSPEDSNDINPDNELNAFYDESYPNPYIPQYNTENINQDEQNQYQYPIPKYQDDNTDDSDNNFVAYPNMPYPYNAAYPNMMNSNKTDPNPELQPWEYGMALPPMPQGSYNQSIIYPRD